MLTQGKHHKQIHKQFKVSSFKLQEKQHLAEKIKETKQLLLFLTSQQQVTDQAILQSTSPHKKKASGHLPCNRDQVLNHCPFHPTYTRFSGPKNIQASRTNSPTFKGIQEPSSLCEWPQKNHHAGQARQASSTKASPQAAATLPGPKCYRNVTRL